MRYKCAIVLGCIKVFAHCREGIQVIRAPSLLEIDPSNNKNARLLRPICDRYIQYNFLSGCDYYYEYKYWISSIFMLISLIKRQCFKCLYSTGSTNAGEDAETNINGINVPSSSCQALIPSWKQSSNMSNGGDGFKPTISYPSGSRG